MRLDIVVKDDWARKQAVCYLKQYGWNTLTTQQLLDILKIINQTE